MASRVLVFLARFLLLALFALAPGAPAKAASLLELNFWLSGPRYDGDVPPCEAMLGSISSQFADKEATFWNSGLAIAGFSHVRELAFRTRAENAMPRRYCAARALMNDGRVRSVNFAIIEDGGFAGFGPGVEWCVAGLDRNWAYNPRCRTAKP